MIYTDARRLRRRRAARFDAGRDEGAAEIDAVIDIIFEHTRHRREEHGRAPHGARGCSSTSRTPIPTSRVVDEVVDRRRGFDATWDIGGAGARDLRPRRVLRDRRRAAVHARHA